MKHIWTTAAAAALCAFTAPALAAPQTQYLQLVAAKHLRGSQDAPDTKSKAKGKGGKTAKAKAPPSAIKSATPPPVKVGPGDTLIGISRKTGVPVADLAKLNGLKAPYHVREGKEIKLPPRQYYAVKSGDTLYSLARRFGVDADDLASENDSTVGKPIRSGQKLYLPDGAADSEAPKPAPAPEPKPKPKPPVSRPEIAPTTAPARPAYQAPTYQKPAPDYQSPVQTYQPPAPNTAPPSSTGPTPAPAYTSPPVNLSPPPPPVRAQPAPTPQTTPPTPEQTPPLTELPRPSHGGLFGHRKHKDDEDQTSPPASQPTPGAATATAPSRDGFETVPARPTYGAPPPRPTTTPGATRPGQIIQTNPAPSTSDVVTAGRGVFIWPTSGKLISGFGPKPDGQRNDGLNIAGDPGDPVRSAAAGEVVYAGDQVPSFGNLVLIKHDGGWVTAYAHLGSIAVKNRDQIAQGQQIGVVGQSGAVDRPQLHFEIRYAASPRDKASPIDPMLLLPGR